MLKIHWFVGINPDKNTNFKHQFTTVLKKQGIDVELE